ncbi:QsdR family transcriptional regulator [Paraconexibacter sp.]|uniref:QsdR family transcriptional regulator n=1 Tax=Paraconexibacter sp. TaxID=2949640 RepID=UPI0035653B8B
MTDLATRYVRPRSPDALALAREMFVRGERVDMQPLAERLGIGRTTLYRWVGDREQLLGNVLGSLADDTWLLVREQADGDGVDWAVDAIRRFLVATSTFPPLREFAEREPQLALRVLLSSDGAVVTHLHAGISTVLRDPRAGITREDDDHAEVIDTLVLIGTALEWTPIAIGQEPEIDRACRLAGLVLRGLTNPEPA